MTSPASSGEEYDAAETFAAALMDQVDKESVRNMVGVQRDMLSRFEKTNEMLINFNILSGNRYTVTSQQFRQHTQLMYDMKKDLDSIFKRIRVIKEKIRKVHPDSFKAGSTAPILEDDEEAEVKITDDVGNSKATAESSSINTSAGSENRNKVLVKDSEISQTSENSEITSSDTKSASDTKRKSPRYVNIPERKLTIN